MRPHQLIVLSAGILVAACTSSGRGTEEDPPEPPQAEPLVVTFTAGDRPGAEARFGDQTRGAFVGSHCWARPAEGGTTVLMCADTVTPTASDLQPLLEVPQGTELVAEGTGKHVGCFVGLLQDPKLHMEGIEMTDRHAVLAQQPGEYALECLASWPHGDDVPFLFGIEIVSG